MKNLKVLIVDDDPDIIETIQYSLEQEDFEVISARNGWEGLGAARIVQPDLVILDVMMPLENGYKVSKIIKADSAAGVISKNIPVILLTARDVSEEKDREEMLMKTSSADLMLYKPFDMDNLIESVRKLLKN